MNIPAKARPAAVATATALGGLAALHVLWATGSTFPVHDADEFAETFLGVDGVGSPGPGACLAVAGALGAAAGAALVRGTSTPLHAPSVTARLASLGVRGAAAVLGARGQPSFQGLLVPWLPGSGVAPRQPGSRYDGDRHDHRRARWVIEGAGDNHQ